MPFPNSKQTKGPIIMSEGKMQENLEQFFQMAAQDLELHGKLKAASDRDAYISSVVELGKEKGYSFNKNEVVAALKAAVQEAEENDVSVSRLSEQELEAVAGGRDTSRNTMACWSQNCHTQIGPFCQDDNRRRKLQGNRRVSKGVARNAGAIINAAFD
jgi:predicted ribosomally synthesized peptide with nif11-like leader